MRKGHESTPVDFCLSCSGMSHCLTRQKKTEMKRHIEQTATESVDAAIEYLIQKGSLHKLQTENPVPVLGSNVVLWKPPVQRKFTGVNRRRPLWERVMLRLRGKLARPETIA